MMKILESSFFELVFCTVKIFALLRMSSSYNLWNQFPSSVITDLIIFQKKLSFVSFSFHTPHPLHPHTHTRTDTHWSQHTQTTVEIPINYYHSF